MIRPPVAMPEAEMMTAEPRNAFNPFESSRP